MSASVEQIGPRDVQRLLQSTGRRLVLLDVREADELALCRIAGALHIPMNDVPARLGELGRSDDIVVFCHHGRRGQSVAAFLKEQGFASVRNMSGGIEAWSLEVDPSVPRY